MIRVVLPVRLRTLAGLPREVNVEVAGVVTPCTVLDALEDAHPVFRGTIREHVTRKRRPFLRFYSARTTGRWSRRTRRSPTWWSRAANRSS